MKILMIRGRNIRSLYGGFVIDFSEGILSKSAMFAIVGPTGSGKSTILDTLCLALYGTCPRLFGARTDIRINGLSGNDSRTAMSHGSSDSLAEVTFEVNGTRYRASWRVRRARKQRQGKIQTVKRDLINETTNQTIASGIKQVDQEICSLIGLDFDQFSRSVLLAQGQFAVFLHAQPDERALLLETISGGDIYTRLSILAHERARLVKEEIDRLETERSRLSLPDEKTLSILTQKIDVISGDLDKTAHILDQLQKQVDWFDRYKVLNNLLDQAKISYQAANKEYEGSEDQQILLNNINQAHSIRAELEREKQLTEELSSVRQRFHELNENLLKQQQQTDEARKQKRTLETAQRALKKNWKELLPQLKQAKEIDKLIDSRKEIVKARKKALSEIQEDNNIRKKEKETLQTDLTNLEDKIKQLNQWLITNKPCEILSEQQSLWQESLNQCKTFQEEKISLEKQKNQVTQKIEELKQQEITINQTIKSFDHDLEKNQLLLKQYQDDLNKHLEMSPPDQVRTTLNSISATHTKITDILRHLKKGEELNKQSEETNKYLKKEQVHLDREKSTIWKVEREREKTFSRIEEVELIIEHLRTQIDAEEFRRHLQPGKPCPVCGSEDHPWAKKESPQESSISHEKKRLEDLKKENIKQNNQLLDLEKSAASLEKTIKHLSEHIDEITTEMNKNQKVLKESISQLKYHLDDSIVPSSLENLDHKRNQNVWEQAIIELNRLQVINENLQQKEQQLNNSIKNVALSIDKIRTGRDDHYKKSDTLQNKYYEILKSKDEIEAKFENGQQQWRKFVERFGAFFDPLIEEWQSRFKSKLDQLESMLIELINGYKTQQRLHSELTTSCDKKKTQLEQVEKELTAVFKKLDHIEDEYKGSLIELNGLLDKRKLLLNGQTVNAAEREYAVLLEQKERDLERIQKHEYEQSTKLQQRITQKDEVVNVLAKTEEQLGQARKKLDEGLNTVQLNRDQAITYISYDDETRQGIKRSLEQLKDSITKARENEEQRCKDLDNFLSSTERPHFSQQELIEDINQKKQYKQDKENELRELKVEQSLCNKNIEQSQLLGKELDEKKKKGVCWLELDEIIGHHKGQKFRKFAQSLTLDHLIKLANRRLIRLAPRYRLERGLGSGLEMTVIDLDQASEHRTISSLSGGETFLVSLALALALSELSSPQTQITTMFIDEGFGTLDDETLDQALSALEILQTEGKIIGLISHVPALQERVTSLIKIMPRGSGQSSVSIETNKSNW